MGSIWDRFEGTDQERAQLIADSDQMIAQARESFLSAVKLQKKDIQAGNSIPASIAAADLMALSYVTGAERGLSDKELFYNMCLLVAAAVDVVARGELREEEMPTL